MQVNMGEAKAQLSQLGKRVWDGEEVIIARAGVPYLVLSPYRERADADADDVAVAQERLRDIEREGTVPWGDIKRDLRL